MLGHDAGPASQNRPGQQGADDGVAYARPCSRDAVFPAELPRIAHEDHSGEIGCAVGEGGEPRPYGTSAQHEAVDVRSVLAAVKADADQNGKIDDQ